MKQTIIDWSSAGLGLGVKKFCISLIKTVILSALVFLGAALANFTVPAQYQQYAEVIVSCVALARAVVAFLEGWLGTSYASVPVTQ